MCVCMTISSFQMLIPPSCSLLFKWFSLIVFFWACCECSRKVRASHLKFDHVKCKLLNSPK